MRCKMGEKCELKSIFEKVGVDIEFLEKNPKENLLGVKIGLTAIDLLVVYFEITKKIGCMIPDDIITEGKFNTYADILEITNSVYKKENISRKEEIV